MMETATLTRDGGNVEPRVDVPMLFVVMRCPDLAGGGSRHSLAGVKHVRLGRGKTPYRRAGDELFIELDDRSVSSQHAVIERAEARWLLQDRGSKNGCYVDGIRTERATLRDDVMIEIGETLLVYRAPVSLRADDAPDKELRVDSDVLDTLLPSLERLFDEVRTVATSRQPIVVHGPTGSGKERVARSVHALSGRAGDFIDINCAAVPDTLIEAELFGHERGAFSGADSARAGLIEAASGGTLFLDEIAELSPRAQAALLRVLQEGQLRRVGSTTTRDVDIRVVAATHRDLGAMVKKGAFREDLYARLAGYTAMLPSLRMRRVDMGVLIARLLAARDTAPRLRGEAAAALMRRPWLRNVRELDQCLGTAASLARGGTIELGHLPDTAADPDDGPNERDEDALRRELIAALTDHQGNVSRVARALNRHRQQIQRWCKRLDIDPASYR